MLVCDDYEVGDADSSWRQGQNILVKIYIRSNKWNK